VQVKGTTNGTATGPDGDFELKKVDPNGVLVLTAVNIQALEVTINGKTELGLKVKGRTGKLDEVQVVAYGTTSQRFNVGNVTSIKSSEIEKQPVNNPLLALQGRVPGLVVTQTSGVPGAGVNIQLRGLNSLSQRTTPLYIIDGVPYGTPIRGAADFVGLSNGIFGSGGDVNPFNFINPADIASIDVLKDADATAIYGSRGSNGVIIVTTKKGKSGTLKADVNFQSGFGQIARKATLMNTDQYLSMRTAAFANDGVVPGVNDLDVKGTWSKSNYTDWQDVMIGNTAKYNDVQLSLSGGSTNSQYLLSGGFHKETTVFPANYNDKKASLHFSINANSENKRFKLVVTGSYLNDNNYLPVVDYTGYSLLAPNAPSLLLPNGTPDYTNFINNVFAARLQTYSLKNNTLVGNASFAYEIIEGLQIKTTLGYTYSVLDENTMSPKASFRPNLPILAFATFNSMKTSSWIAEPQISYSTQLKRTKLTALVGSSFQNRDGDGQRIEGTNYSSDALLRSLSAAGTIAKGPSLYEQYRYNSLFARLSVIQNEKYILNLSGRRDGSSRFGPGKQFGNFGAIGIGWIFSEEKILQTILPGLSFGKLRASFGTTGNEPSENYKYLELYDFATSSGNINLYQGGVSLTPTGLPAPSYSWELNKKLEVGLEIGLWNDRILINGSFYQNRCSNQLLQYNLPYITGFSGVFANMPATIQNKGWEISLNTINIKSEDFNWTSSFNISWNKDKLVAFQDIEKSSYSNSYRIGERISDFRVYRYAGVNTQTGIYQYYDAKGNVTNTPAFADKNAYVNITPKYYGGMQNLIRYKDIEFDFFIQFTKQTGKNYLFQNSMPGQFNASAYGNQPAELFENWKGAGNNADFQRFSRGAGPALNAYNLIKESDKAYSDASYMRLKNASLSYFLPRQFSKKYHIQNAKVFIHAQNLITLTHFKGVDPENQNFASLPPLRIISFGINLTL
jgi:TonB-linked SusC/RagA family outer membrane protein